MQHHGISLDKSRYRYVWLFDPGKSIEIVEQLTIYADCVEPSFLEEKIRIENPLDVDVFLDFRRFNKVPIPNSIKFDGSFARLSQ
jgi:hypothetical protein